MAKNFILILILSIALLLSSTSIADADHPMKFNVILKSLNPNLDELNNLDYGYQFEFQYGFNKNIYAKAISTIYNHGQVGYGGRLGYKFNYNKFSPYAEVGFDTKPAKDNRTTYFAYDIGSYYHLTSCVSPFIELDNADLPQRTAAKIGSVFKISKKFDLKADYIQDISHSGNGAELELSYNF